MKQRKRETLKSKNYSESNDDNLSETRDDSKASQSSKDPLARVSLKRIIVRCICIVGIIFFLNYLQNDGMETFASAKDDIEGKHFTVQCSKDYAKEISKFPGCVPKGCGRYLSDSVITKEEAQILYMIAEKGLSLGGSDGGASIMDLHSGALSKGSSFINIYKLDKNHKIITNEDLNFYRRIKDKIKVAIVRHFGLQSKFLHLTHPTFFSRINDAPAKTIHDQYWHPHVDKETYPSFHYTSLLYLTHYGRDFEGGRFLFLDQGINRTIEPRPGRLSAFTSGWENVHQVEKVTKGTRYAITISFTCDPNQAIRDPNFIS